MKHLIRGKLNSTNKHRKSLLEIILPLIEQSDIILEVLDSRFIEETRNLELEAKIKEQGRRLIFILNKVDLISLNEIYKKTNLENLKPYVFISCKLRRGIKDLRNMIKIEAKKLNKEKETNKFKKIVKVGIIGYPNTGKSSIINILSGRKVAPTSPIPGFTRGIKEIKLSQDIILLDTPGIIPRKENSSVYSRDLKKHGIIGVGYWHTIRNPDLVVAGLMQKYPGVLEKYYKIDANGDSEVLMQELGKRWNMLKKGGLVNVDKTARLILKNWQEGKIDY